MNNYKKNTKWQLEQELNDLKSLDILNPNYLKKEMLIWFIRTNIAFLLYVWLWQYSWVRWSLYFYVPLNLFSIGSIVFARYSLGRKVDRLQDRLNHLVGGVGIEEEE